VLVVHAYNPSYSGGRDQKDHSSKPEQANHSRAPVLKTPFTKRAGGVVQGVGPEFKLWYHKKKKKKKKKLEAIISYLFSISKS
jgi:hypothetical protein